MSPFPFTFLMSLGDRIFPTQPYQPLPETYFQQPDWQARLSILQTPAAWRRQAQVR